MGEIGIWKIESFLQFTGFSSFVSTSFVHVCRKAISPFASCCATKQYIGKIENASNLRLHNHRKSVKNPNTIFACKYFQNLERKFDKHRKFIITEKLAIRKYDKATVRQRSTDTETGVETRKLFLGLNIYIKNNQAKIANLPGGFFLEGEGAHCTEKFWILIFLHCLKWVFQPVFCSFNNTFRFHLMTSKWG